LVKTELNNKEGRQQVSKTMYSIQAMTKPTKPSTKPTTQQQDIILPSPGIHNQLTSDNPKVPQKPMKKVTSIKDGVNGKYLYVF